VCDSGHVAQGNWLSHLFGKNGNPPPPTAGLPSAASNPPSQPGETTPPEPEKKKGLLGKVFGIFGSSKKPADTPKPQP
jgi:hypothetical protein